MTASEAVHERIAPLREMLGGWAAQEATALRDAAARALGRHLARLDMRDLYGAEWHRQANVQAAGGTA